MAFKIASAWVDVEYRTDAAEQKLQRAFADKRETVKVDADVAAAEARLAQLKAKASGAAGDVKIQADADVRAAETKLDALRAKAASVGSTRPTVRADADTAAATTKLSAVQAETSALDGRRATVNVDADVGAALAKIALVTAAIGALGVGAVAGLGAVGAIGAAVAGGVGALGASLGGVGSAVKNLGKETAGAGGAASQSASNHLAMASAIDRVKMSQLALANTTANTAASIRRADESIVSAKRDLERAYADAGRAAADAASSVADAEQRLASTQRDAQFAQEDLTRAREDAARAAMDLTERISDLALSERDANLSVLEAKQRLDQVNADGRSTELQKQRAQLQYDQALERVNDVGDAQAEAAKEKAKLDAEGIDGSDGVQAALRRVEDANAAVGDAQEAVARARQDQADAAVEAQDRIADATKRVADAELAAAEARRQAEYQLAQAKQAVIEAQRGVQQASQAASSGGGGGGGAPNPLAGLTPAVAAFAVFLRGFLDGPVAELRRVGQENLLPGLTRGLQGLTPIIRGQMIPAFGEFNRALGSMFESAIPALGRFSVPLLRLGTDTLQALSPLGPIFDGFVQKFDAMTVRVGSNGTLQAGMAGLSQVIGALLTVLPNIIEVGLRIMAVIGQPLADAFVAIIDAVLALAEALGPGLAATLDGLVPIFEGLTSFMTENPALVRTMTTAVLALVAGFRAFGPISAVVGALTGPIGLVVLGVAALAAGVAYAYTHSATFRAEVARLWEALQRAGAVIMDTVGPALSSLWQTVKNDLAPAFTGLLEAIMPVVTWLVDKLGPGVAAFLETAVKQGEAAVEALSAVLDVFGWIIDKIPGIDGVKSATDSAGQAATQYGEDVREMARKSEDAKRASDDLARSLDKVTDAALSGRQAERDYYAAVDAATQAVKTNGRTLDLHTTSGRANNSALDALAKATNTHTAALATNGASQKTLDATMATARASLIKTATQMGMNEGAAKAYASQVLKIPKAATTSVTLNGYTSTMNNLQALLTRIALVNGQRVAIQVSSNAANVREDRVAARARGGPVTRGVPYIVGEEQAELFVPDQSGTIIPDLGLIRRPVGALSSGGGSAIPQQRTEIAIGTLNVNTVGAMDLNSHTDRMAIARKMREALVALEAGER